MRFDLIGALALAAAFSLYGCSGATSMVRALGKDPSSVCISSQSPYAPATIGRANRPGAEVSITAGGCTIKHAPDSTTKEP